MMLQSDQPPSEADGGAGAPMLGTPSGIAPLPPTAGGGVIVDTHCHLWNDLNQLGAEVAKKIRASTTQPWDRLDTSPQAFEQAIELVHYVIIHGLESQATGASVPPQQIAQSVAQQPNKALGFVGIDPMATGFLGRIDQAQDLGLVGVTISPAIGGYHPTHSRAMRLYDRCQERGLPVLIHPAIELESSARMEYLQPFWYDEVAHTFPQLRLVIAGMGLPWVEQTLMLIGKHEHCYADLSGLTAQPWQLYNVLLLAYQQGAMDRLLLGSDFPFNTPKAAIHNIYSVNTVTHGTHLPMIPREQLRGIVERDALACLGLKRPGDGSAQAQQAAGPAPAHQAMTPVPAHPTRPPASVEQRS